MWWLFAPVANGPAFGGETGATKYMRCDGPAEHHALVSPLCLEGIGKHASLVREAMEVFGSTGIGEIHSTSSGSAERFHGEDRALETIEICTGEFSSCRVTFRGM